MRIVSLVSGKGGVGKTTIASNLGVVLSRKFSRKVIVMDANLMASHLGFYLGMESMPTTLNHVLKGEADINEAIYNHPSGMKVIPSSSSVKDIQGVDPSLLEHTVKKLYGKYVGMADFLLIDCAPGLGRQAFSGIRSADELLFVTIPYAPALMDIVRCSHLVREMGIRHAGVVVNMVDQGKHEMTRQDVERFVGLPVIGAVPRDKKVLSSLSRGSPVTVLHPKARASRGIEEVASSLLSHTIIKPSYPEVPR